MCAYRGGEEINKYYTRSALQDRITVNFKKTEIFFPPTKIWLMTQNNKKQQNLCSKSIH